MKHEKTRIPWSCPVIGISVCDRKYARGVVRLVPSEIHLLEAVQSALRNHPLLQSQQAQVEVTRGAREQAAGAFDLTTQSGLVQNRASSPLTGGQQEQNLLSGIDAATQSTNLTDYGFSFSKTFRNGITVSPVFDLNRITDNIFNTSGVNTSSMSLKVSLPLLRGRSRTVVTAQEEAAKAEVDATVYDLNQLVSQLMANVAGSYWNLVAAQKSLTFARDAEARGRAYLDNVEALVAADHVPRNDLHEARANLAQRSSNRIAAEQQFLAAQRQLELDMGTDADHILTLMPQPGDDFPSGENAEPPSDSEESLRYYVEQAFQNRADYLASQRRSRESNILLIGARNRLLPQLNLNLSSGYSGLQEGRNGPSFFQSFVAGATGPNATVGITYSFSHANHSAKGAYRQATAVARQSELQSTEVARTISASVAIALAAVRSSILHLRTAKESVQSYESALNGEQEKYKGGIGSIVSILTIEDKLNSAQADKVQAQLAYANALTQFRFATGTLTSPNALVHNISVDTFLTLPFMSAPRDRR